MTTIDHDRGEDFTPEQAEDNRPRRLFGVNHQNNTRTLLMDECVNSATTEDGSVFIAQGSDGELMFIPYRHWSTLILAAPQAPRREAQPSLFENPATPQRQDGWR